MKSNHLEYAKQTYFKHMNDSMYYSWCSLKASFFFFVHSFIPDVFIKNGSDTIKSINNDIMEKYNNLHKEFNPSSDIFPFPKQNNSIRKFKDYECGIVISAFHSILASLQDPDDYYNAIQIMNLLYEIPSLDSIFSNVDERLLNTYFNVINMALENYLDICYVDDFDKGIEIKRKIRFLFTNNDKYRSVKCDSISSSGSSSDSSSSGSSRRDTVDAKNILIEFYSGAVKLKAYRNTKGYLEKYIVNVIKYNAQLDNNTLVNFMDKCNIKTFQTVFNKARPLPKSTNPVECWVNGNMIKIITVEAKEDHEKIPYTLCRFILYDEE